MRKFTHVKINCQMKAHDRADFMNALIPKKENECIDIKENKTIDIKENKTIDIKENKTIVNHFIPNEENTCYNDALECINEASIKHEENNSNDQQMPNEAKLWVDDQEYFIDAFMPKEETESLDIEESKIIVNTFIDNEEIKCNNGTRGWYTHTIESKNEDFAADKSTCSFLKLEAKICSKEQIVDRIKDSKLQKHKCLLCNYSVSQKIYLQRHIDSVHLKLKNHRCHLCDYSASFKNNLQRHLDAVHLKLRNHKCHICDYSASQKMVLQNHILSMHTKLKNHKCPICNYSSSLKKWLQRHIHSVHLKLKKHKCHSCDYSSSQKTPVQRHINSVHLKLKNHICHICDYRTSRKSDLQKHIRFVHLKLKNRK